MKYAKNSHYCNLLLRVLRRMIFQSKISWGLKIVAHHRGARFFGMIIALNIGLSVDKLACFGHLRGCPELTAAQVVCNGEGLGKQGCSFVPVPGMLAFVEQIGTAR